MEEQVKFEPYNRDSETVLNYLHSSPDGITESEAEKRIAQYGQNKIERVRSFSSLKMIARQFKDLLILLLIASAVISYYLGDRQTGTILVVIIVINVLISYRQEFKAEKIMQKLSKLVHPKTKAKRAGNIVEVETAQIVPGDIVYVQAGDSVPADLRVIDEADLQTNDFALTGESNPSRKFSHEISQTVPLANRHNLLFAGTTVATGEGYGVVFATGMQTELGRIAGLSQETVSDLSPLQRELNHTAKRITQGTLLLCVVLVFVAFGAHFTVREAFIFAVGIASAMIPQGLLAEVNVALAQAAAKLAKARALVKKLSAVETLGATTVICTDKTGTLTKNEMTVQQIIVGKHSYFVNGVGYKPIGKIYDALHKTVSPLWLKENKLFFLIGALASNAILQSEHDWRVLGDPTEGALLTLAAKAGIDISKLDKTYPKLKEFSFDSGRKRMSEVRNYDGTNYIFAKGSPESILEICTHIKLDGQVRKITAQDKQFIKTIQTNLATDGMRNLAYAYKKLAKESLEAITMQKAEAKLVFAGLVSMIDPPRTEVPEAMRAAKLGHIEVSILTGDNALTAEAVAKQAGFSEDKPAKIINTEQMQQMNNAAIVSTIQKGGVIFSRVSPEDKLRIVNSLKQVGAVVAVTGDGINDAPALKRADIGVAMGNVGTDVAKDAADLVLLDDSFHTLVSAIKQGRVIFQNIKKATLVCLTSNGGELFTVLFSMAGSAFFGIPIAITVVQILAIDLVAELFPIMALGWDPEYSQLMTKQPRKLSKHILSASEISQLIWTGLLMGVLAYINYLLFFRRHGVAPASGTILYAQATSLTYLTIVLCQLCNVFSRRTAPNETIFHKYFFSNYHLLIAIGVSIFCVLNIIYNPWFQPYFGTAALSALDWLCAALAAAIYLAVRETYKIVNSKRHALVSSTA